MELSKLTLFSAVKKRLAWLTQRQEVLSQNIANADTPDYRSRDLKVFKFKELIRRENAQINMVTTGKSHLGGQRKRIRDFSEFKEPKPFETAPGGNNVIIEEQAAKVNETNISHKLTTELYRKNLAMIKIALGK